MAQVILKPGTVQPVWAGHPWVFSQAVAAVRGEPEAGDDVQVLDPRGNVLGRGFYHPSSAIAVRLFSFADEPFSPALVRSRMERAVALRAAWGLPSDHTTAYRLIHGEGDGLPGLVVDRFGDTAVVQVGSAGMARRMDAVIEALCRVLAPRNIVNRTDPRTASQEGFDPGPAMWRGRDAALRFSELGVRYDLPAALSQKTGFYLDQRPLRERVRAWSAGKRVLDLYCYVGSTGLNAAAAGAAEVLCVDSSPAAVDAARRLAANNGWAQVVRCARNDAFAALEAARRDAPWDLVFLDPPKLAAHRKHRLRAQKLLRALVQAAAPVVADGGLLVLSSCSAALDAADVHRALSLGTAHAGRSATAVEVLSQGPDHPVPAAFPEGRYLTTVAAHIHRR